MKTWAITEPSLAIHGHNPMSIAVGVDNDVTMKGFTMAVDRETYNGVMRTLAETSERARRLQMEIDTRWEPALRKAKGERDQFQQDMMNSHEKAVESKFNMRQVIDNLAAQIDNHEQIEKNRVVQLAERDERIAKLGAEVEELMKVDYWQDRYNIVLTELNALKGKK